MRLRTAAGASVVLLLLSIPGVLAAPLQIAASGTFPTTTTLSEKITLLANGGLLIYDSEKGPITGTFSGEYYSFGNVTVSSDGLHGNYTALDYCFCNFTDTNGQVFGLTTFYEKGTVTITNKLTGAGYLLSHAMIVQSTIKGLAGYVDFYGTANGYTLVNQGIYLGSVTDP